MFSISERKHLDSFSLRRSAYAVALTLSILGIGSQAQTASSNGRTIQRQSGSGSDTAVAAQKQAEATDLETPVRQVPDPGVITTNQSISPAGVQSVFESRVYGIAFGASSSDVYAATNSKRGALVYKLNWQSNEIVEKLVHPNSSSGLQGLTYDPVSRSVLLTTIWKAGADGTVAVGLVSKWNENRDSGLTPLGKNEIAEVAVSPKDAPGTHYGIVALTFNDQAAILDLDSGATLSNVRTGIAPFGVLIDAKNTTAYVSNWGGRFPRPGDLTATTGSRPGADKIVVDARGVAASGTISRIDLKTGMVTAEMDVGLHPTSLELDDSRRDLHALRHEHILLSDHSHGH